MAAPQYLLGQVVSAHGRQYQVELLTGPDIGKCLLCVPRGKKSDVVCGDTVQLKTTSPNQGVIEAIEPRQNLLYRSNEFRQKLIAANVNQVVVVCAVEPAFSEDLLTRCLVAASHEEMAVCIVLNKADLIDRLPAAQQILAPYEALGYPVITLSAKENVEALRQCLHDKTTVLVGQSGMGKSTLINALIPDAAAATREISTVLDSGKHTTTYARLYHLNPNSHLIDSPGLQAFGLAHLSHLEIAMAFSEFRPFLGKCRFRDCHHRQEPGCALIAANAAGHISPQRLAVYQRLTAG